MKLQPYDPPGPGTWELDTTHLAKPVSRYCAEFFPDALARGFKEGTERYGLFITHIQYSMINGFGYMKPMLACVPEDAPPGPPPEGFFEQPELVRRFANGDKAIKGKLWREDMKRWDEEVKPDSIRRNQALQDVDVSSLSTDDLVEHLIACRDNAAEMLYRHHVFTIPSIIATGHYIAEVTGFAPITAKEALDLLKGSSPVSAGIAADELAEVGRLLDKEGIAPEQFGGQDAQQTLDALRSQSGPAGQAVQRYVDRVSYQLTSGYDITERYMLELPELLVKTIWSSRPSAATPRDNTSVDERIAALRSRVPADRQADFDSLLGEARHMNRLRDERGVYNEAKAVGVARRAVLEAGRRLEREGKLDEGSLLVHASHDEMISLLQGKRGPSSEELKERRKWAVEKSVDDVPPYLGPAPEPPPPAEALPEAARLATTAINAVLGNVFDLPEPPKAPGSGVSGLPVSPGVYEGTARLIKDPSDFHSIQHGDVLVTRNTSASFNVVLPLLGAIVTDRGGQLSHAAIVSREYGIPGVVSTRNATAEIPDGARVRVNGDAGTVDVL